MLVVDVGGVCLVVSISVDYAVGGSIKRLLLALAGCLVGSIAVDLAYRLPVNGSVRGCVPIDKLFGVPVVGDCRSMTISVSVEKAVAG